MSVLKSPVVNEEVINNDGFLGWSQCSEFPSVLWHRWLGDRKAIEPVKSVPVIIIIIIV